MQVPFSLTGWNLTTIRKIAASGDEGERYDFKRDWPDGSKLSNLACAFANTKGGFIVFGVGQKNGKFVVEGIKPNPEIYRDFHDRLKVEPEIRTEPPKKIELANGHMVYVFEIRESTNKPHMPTTADQRAFWKRMPSKNERMTLTEVRYFMNEFERKREQLTLFLIDMHFKLEDMEIYWQQNRLQSDFTPHDVSIIDRTLAGTYSLVRDMTDFIIFVQEYRSLIVNWNILKAEMPKSNSLRIQTMGGERAMLDAIFSRVERFRFLYLKLSELLYDHFEVENPYRPITAFGQHRPKRKKRNERSVKTERAQF